MSQVGETYVTGGGAQQGVSPVLQGGDSGVTGIWVGVLGTVRRDDWADRGIPCEF